MIKKILLLAALALSLPSALWAADASVVTLLRQSQQAAARGQVTQALDMVEQALAQDPAYPPLWRQKASLQIRAKDYAGALDTLAVALKVEPQSVENNVLELTALLRQGDAGDAKARQALDRYVGGLPENMAGSLLTDLLAKPEGQGDLRRFLGAWKPGTADGQLTARLATAYAANDPSALRELAATTVPASQKDVIAALRFYAGKQALADKRLTLAHDLLDKAMAAGYDPVAVTGELGWVHFNQGEFTAAADTWESQWRNAPNVGNWASWIADARLKAKDYAKAAEFLDRSLQFYPNNTVLQGEYLLALRLSDQGPAADALEQRLRGEQDQDGLHFGLALIAENQGNLPQAAAELRQIQNRKPFRDQFIELADAMVAAIGVKGDPSTLLEAVQGLVAGLDVRASILRDVGWKLWAAKRSDAAVSFWKESLSGGLPTDDPLLAKVVPLLVETGRLPEAMALLRQYAPDVTPLGLAWTLAVANRWDLVSKVLASGPAGAYPDLFMAMGALQGGQPQLALDKMHALAAIPAGGLGQVPFAGFNAEGQIVRGLLTPTLAGEIYRRIAGAVAGYQLTAGFFFLTPPAWATNVTPKAMAPIWAEAGKVLWNTGNLTDAATFLQKALDADPGQKHALLYLALVKKHQGQDAEAKALLDRALVSASPFDREYALGEFAFMDGDVTAALPHYEAALALRPDDAILRLRAVNLLVGADRFEAARRADAWFETQVAKKNKSVFSAAAAARLDLGDAKGAETLYRIMLAENPKSLDYLAGLGMSLNRQNRYAETVAALTTPYAASGSPHLGGVIGEALLGLGEYHEAIRQAEIGLAQHPKDKELLRQAAEAAQFAKEPALCEGFAQRYLELDPDSSTVQDMYGQALLDQEKYDDALAHYTALTAKNPTYLPALRGIFNVYQYTGKAAKAYDAAQTVMTVAPDNATLRLQYAIAAAADHDYRPAYPTMEKVRAFGPGSPVLCLYYADVRDAEVPGKVRLSQLADHLRAVAAAGGAFLSVDELAQRPTGEEALKGRNTDLAPKVLLLVDRTSAAVLDKIDTLLAEVGGKAVLVVGGESLLAGTPYLPDAAMVKRLAGNGRWSLALTDHKPPKLDAPGAGSVDLWNTCGVAACLPGFDTPEARLRGRLRALDPKGEILGDARPVFFYPGGDAPTDILGATEQGRDAYQSVVADSFPMAFQLTPEGYWTPVSDPRLIAAKAVSPSLDAAGLTRLLEQTNPMRQVSLELAKVYSWQEQLGQAENYFKEAAELKVNPADLTYHNAVNAYYMHDDPVAVTRAEKAVETAPDAPRTHVQLGRAELRTRPKVEASFDTWWDSDNRRYWWWGLGGDVHVLDSLVLFAKAGRTEWSIDSYQRQGQMQKAFANTLTNGYLSADDVYNVLHARRVQYLSGEDLVVGARWFFYPQFWLEAQGQLTSTDSGPSTWLNGMATLHGPLAPKGLPVDGTWDLQAANERIDTVEAIAEQIMANRVSLFTHNRLFNYYDLFLNIHGISRTDGNKTGSVDGRLLARLFEYPLVSLGYAFQFANSDRNPPQYWAPLDLVTHLAYGTFGYSPTRWFNINGSLGYGPSRDRTNDWRNVWRANAGMDITMKERLKLSLKYSYFSTPTYNLSEAWAGISYTF